MKTVPARVLLTVGAWLLGVIAATGGSLVAVSLIGQSIAAPPTQQLTVSAVNHALASADRDVRPERTATPGPGRHRPARRGGTARGSSAAGRGSGTVLGSPGGSVLAACGSSGAYLISWSPQQGYQADDVVRGPAAAARVVFLAGRSGVSLAVTCTRTAPTETVTDVWGDDDGGEPGDS